MEAIKEKLNKYKIPDFVLITPPKIISDFFVALTLLSVLILFKINAILDLETHVIGGAERDAGLYLWLLENSINDLFTKPWFNTNTFYPYGLTLAWSDNFLVPSLIITPLLLIGIPLTIAFNLLVLFVSFLNGFCTYRFCFRITGSLIPAAIAGLLFMNLSYFCSHLGHPQLQYAFFIPLAFSALFKFLANPSLGKSVLLGLVITFSFLSSVYYTIFICLAILLCLFFLFVLRPTHYKLNDAIKFFGGIIICVIPMLFVIFPYLDVKETFGNRGIYESYYFSANFLSYLAASPLNFLYSKSALLSHSEAFLFPGVIILLFFVIGYLRLQEARVLRFNSFLFLLFFTLASGFSINFIAGPTDQYLTALFSWMALIVFFLLLNQMGKLEKALGYNILTNRDIIAIFIGISLVSYFVSFGPLGNPEKGEYALGIFRVLYEVFPGFDSLRAIGRIGILVLFSGCVIISFTLSRFKNRKGWPLSLLSITLLISLLENYNLQIPTQELPKKPSVFSYMAEIEDPNSVIIILPFTRHLKSNATVKSWGDFAELNVNYMRWSSDLKNPIVNGYSGQQTYIMKEFPRKMSGFPDQRSLNTLGMISNLKYIVVLSKYLPNFNKTKFFKKITLHEHQLKYLYNDNDDNFIFEFSAKNRVKDTLPLLVPAYVDGFLNLELMALFEKEESTKSLDVYYQGLSEEIIFTSIPVPSDGQWNEYTIRLPHTGEKVRPLKLIFKPKDNAKIMMRNRTFRQD